VVISASHNPYYDNGIKIFSRDGFKLPDEMEKQIEELEKAISRLEGRMKSLADRKKSAQEGDDGADEEYWRHELKSLRKGLDAVMSDEVLDSEEGRERLKKMMPYQINSNLLGKSSAYIMHDMPMHRGYEISPEAIENPKAIIYEQAENRLYSAKAILLKLME
jgi:ornithine carbamoyltransferase